MSGRTKCVIPAIIIARHTARRLPNFQQFHRLRRGGPQVKRHAAVYNLRAVVPGRVWASGPEDGRFPFFVYWQTHHIESSHSKAPNCGTKLPAASASRPSETLRLRLCPDDQAMHEGPRHGVDWYKLVHLRLRRTGQTAA